MGEVYKARDSRLDRFVAIKVLPSDKIADAERTRRFIQEARSASALNHPNIVTIYDVGSEHGADFLAMELVDGRTLEDLVPRDGFRIPELLRYAVQAADALAKAHAAGIIHRDFKPGNVMITSDGLVKVLDFGLAKLVQSTASGPRDGAHTAATASDPGLIVGTAAFMSPEQAEGRPIDARSDIFSFGAVLYEMATGQRAFRGDTAMSTISAILRDDPKPASAIRGEIPAELDRVIKRCLRKDPARRFQTMADLKVALEELKEESDSGSLAGAVRATAPTSRSGLPLAAVAIGVAVLALAGAAAWFGLRKVPTTTTAAMQRPVPLTSYPGQESDATFSPDGSQVAFSWTGEKDDNRDIYVKVVGADAPLRLTTDPAAEGSPKWSPDGRIIAFARYGTDDSVQVMLIPPLGGTERTLARFAHGRRLPMLDWSPDGKWLAVAASAGEGPVRVYIVALDSGEARPLTMPSASAFDIAPAFSPDGRALAFTRGTGMNVSELRVQRLSAAMEAEGEPRKLPAEGSFARGPVWTVDGREILYTSGFNLRSNVYRMAADGSAPSRVVELLGDGASGLSLSRTGQRLAFERTGRNSNVWRLDLQSPLHAAAPLISSTVREASPQYSPDGKRIVFYSNRNGTNQIWICDADGMRAAQLTSMDATITGSPRWFPNGRQIAFDSNATGDWQIYVMDADGGKPKAVTSGTGGHFAASVSRDGRWIYFGKGNTDPQVWKVPAAGGAEVQVTAGADPMESPDGKFLYFTRPLGRLNQNSLWRMPAGGGQAVQVVPLLFRYDYAATTTGVYYATLSETDAPSRIFYLDATGKATPIYTLAKPLDLGLAISPDGRYLLFAQNDFVGSDLMLVENFK
jgi:Tol biopolymer transport system component